MIVSIGRYGSYVVLNKKQIAICFAPRIYEIKAQRGPQGALLVGEPDEVIEKIIRHSQALGGISRITFMMNPASLPHAKLMRATELIGTHIIPALREVGENYMEVL